jgi:hypothetical protein
MATVTGGGGAALDPDEVRRLAAEFDATPEQIEEAVAAVGTDKADIELHLKGSRASSNSDRVHDAGV